jgi:hypothetical protein
MLNAYRGRRSTEPTVGPVDGCQPNPRQVRPRAQQNRQTGAPARIVTALCKPVWMQASRDEAIGALTNQLANDREAIDGWRL